MAAQVSYLYKYCPACGGRARAEAKLPLAHAQRPEEYYLDELCGLVEKQTIGFLLALVELLPYKIFTCRKCGHEFQLQNRAAKDLVHSMLAAMQPWAYQRVLYNELPRMKPLEPAMLEKLAAKAELDVERFAACRIQGKYRDKVQRSKVADEKLGVDGVPTFFVGEEKVVGNRDYSHFKTVIDNAMTASGDVTCPPEKKIVASLRN